MPGSKSARKKGEPVPDWKDEKDYLRDPTANPPVAWPMHLFDCCPISDGASCLLLVAEDMARNFTDAPIYVAGMGQGSGYSLHAKKDLTTFEATRAAAKEAYEMSGLTPQDVQFSEVHDCFSIAEIVHMEDLGFVKPGEGHKAVAEGMTRLDGPKPINTSGGLKSKGPSGGGDRGRPALRGLDAAEGQSGQEAGPQPQPAGGRGAQPGRYGRNLHLHHSGEEVNAWRTDLLTIPPTSSI